MTEEYDDLVIGAGMAGLSVAGLLAAEGRRVCVLEAHDVPGGNAHTFTLREHRFCAQVHYVFGCGEGETIHRLLDRLGLAERVPFVRLDPEGFDHVVVGSDRVRIPNGLGKFRDRLIARFPDAREPLIAYFRVVTTIGDELSTLGAIPERIGLGHLREVVRHRHLVRYLRWTLDDLYDSVRMPQRLRAILAGQSGDYLLPPRDVSLLLHVALVCAYDRGAYYPKKHYFHFVEALADSVRTRPGSALMLEHEVDRIHVDGNRVVGVTTTNGKRLTAKRYVSNVDPRRTAELAGWQGFEGRDRRRLDYDYSCGTFTMYLAVRGLDLREHGFGSFNVWHYPHDDLNRMYDDQLVKDDLTDPWLFISTPTLHSSAPGLCPPGDHTLEIATACDHGKWARLRATNRRAYNHRKRAVREAILDRLEASYLPGLRDKLAVRVTGSPATNERFIRAPAGNAYGAALTPRNVSLGRGPYKASLENLWMANATAGFPSVAGAIGAGMDLYEKLAR